MAENDYICDTIRCLCSLYGGVGASFATFFYLCIINKRLVAIVYYHRTLFPEKAGQGSFFAVMVSIVTYL